MEQKQTIKERILVSGCQLQEHYDTQLLYFTCSSLSDDDKRLYLISNRDGHPNVFFKDLETGEERQLTRNRKGNLKGYVYFDGVLNEGLIFFDAPAEQVWPSGLMDFRSSEGIAWYQADVTGENRKVNADAKGWLAYANDGLLLLKQFEDLDKSQPAPGEAEVQVYVNRGKTYIELESQGAYTVLKPGERLNWKVRWMLVPCTSEAVPSAALLKQVHNLIK